MKAMARCLFALAGVTSLLLATSLFAQPTKAFLDKEAFHPTRILVKFAAREKTAGQATLLQQQGLTIQRRFSLLPQVAVLDLADGNSAKSAKALAPADRSNRLQQRIAALRATGLFEYVEPDYVRQARLEPTDTAYTDGTLWALHNFGQNGGTNGADIGAAAAWDITTGSTNVIVAIVDTGIRYTHQDLAAQIWRDPGTTNFVCGTNAVAGNSDPMDDSVDQYGNPEGHGTHVAGTIGAAANNGAPHVGVAWNVRLMACKFLNANGSGYTSEEVECLQFALTKGARVINASYGGYYYSQTEYEAIRTLRDQGVLFVAAAGNEAGNNDSWLRSYPSSFDLHNIIAVAAIDRADNLAYFSNYGQSTVHLGAPGVEIFSCINSNDSAYASYAGTSMATPHVSGAAALLLARYPNSTLTELRRRILDGVVQIPSLMNKTATGGRLNVYNSLVATPKGTLQVEVSPRGGQTLPAGKAATVYAIITDLLPATNATVTASIASFTNLTFVGGGTNAVYTVSFLVPTNLPSLEVTLRVSAPGWPDTTNLISYPVVLPPPNDNFANRIAISTNLCEMRATGSNLNGSMEAGEPIHADQVVGHSVWWSWTALSNSPVKISTTGSGFDTLLAVYTGQVVSSLTLVAANDDASDYDRYSAVTFDAVAGTEYQIAVDGYAARQGQIVLQVLPLTSSIPLGEALNIPEIKFTSGGNVPWLGQTCTTHDGTNAARSGPIEANGQSWMETTVVGPGTLRFWWKVSSEANYDYLRFYINDIEQSSLTGEVDWQQQHYWLGVGTNTLRWLYSKDYSVSMGQDTGWVDELSFVHANSAIPTAMGDLDGDGQPTVLDMTLLVGYLRDTNSLRPQVAVFADVNRDGVINSNDIPALANAILGRTVLLPALDTDGDGIPDVLEPLMGLNPTNKFSLGDGIADGDQDFDMDGLSNARELALGTDPLRADTDGDGWSDEAELTAGSSPLDAASRPYLMVVSAPQVAMVLPANEGSGGLALNTTVASPPVSLLLPAHEGSGGLAGNIVLASPPVAIVLPVNEGSGELVLNTTVASPPVSLVLPAHEGRGGLADNTVLASPPVAMVLPVNVGPGGLTPNTTVASPPVAFVLPADQGAARLTNNSALPPVQIKLEVP